MDGRVDGCMDGQIDGWSQGRKKENIRNSKW